MLVGIYGTSFHVGLLSIQLAYNQATLIPSPISEQKYATSQYGSSVSSDNGGHFNPSPYDYHIKDITQYNAAHTAHFISKDIVDKAVVDVVYPILLFAHVIGIVVNLLLVYGVWKGKRHLMVPWLLLQGLLGILLAVLALYYLVVFPDKSDCFQYAGLSQNTAVSRNYHPYQQVSSIEKSSSTLDAASECSILLWYCVVMVLALFILVYYFYVVCDFVSQVYFYADDGAYEESAIARIDNDIEEKYNQEYPIDIDPASAEEHFSDYQQKLKVPKNSGKPTSRLSVGSVAKLSISSSTSKLKSTNKGRKDIHVVEIVEREPDPLYSQFEDISRLRFEEPSASRTQEISAFDSIVSADVIDVSLPPKEDTSVAFQSSRREIKPYSHQSQRKNVSFVEDTKPASLNENR